MSRVELTARALAEAVIRVLSTPNLAKHLGESRGLLVDSEEEICR